jgi:hypothetical protein
VVPREGLLQNAADFLILDGTLHHTVTPAKAGPVPDAELKEQSINKESLPRQSYLFKARHIGGSVDDCYLMARRSAFRCFSHQGLGIHRVRKPFLLRPLSPGFKKLCPANRHLIQYRYNDSEVTLHRRLRRSLVGAGSEPSPTMVMRISDHLSFPEARWNGKDESIY